MASASITPGILDQKSKDMMSIAKAFCGCESKHNPAVLNYYWYLYWLRAFCMLFSSKKNVFFAPQYPIYHSQKTNDQRVKIKKTLPDFCMLYLDNLVQTPNPHNGPWDDAKSFASGLRDQPRGGALVEGASNILLCEIKTLKMSPITDLKQCGLDILYSIGIVDATDQSEEQAKQFFAATPKINFVFAIGAIDDRWTWAKIQRQSLSNVSRHEDPTFRPSRFISKSINVGVTRKKKPSELLLSELKR